MSQDRTIANDRHETRFQPVVRAATGWDFRSAHSENRGVVGNNGSGSVAFPHLIILGQAPKIGGLHVEQITGRCLTNIHHFEKVVVKEWNGKAIIEGSRQVAGRGVFSCVGSASCVLCGGRGRETLVWEDREQLETLSFRGLKARPS